jgi:hypothetical protein
MKCINFIKKTVVKKTTCINEINWLYNEPVSTVSTPDTSILPERFRSITEPSVTSIVSEDLCSITEPDLQMSEELFTIIAFSGVN